MGLWKSKAAKIVLMVAVVLWLLTELLPGGVGFLGRSAVVGKPTSVSSRLFTSEYRVKAVVGDTVVIISVPEKLIEPIMNNLGKEHMFVYQRWVLLPWHVGSSNNEMIGFKILEEPRPLPVAPQPGQK